MIKKVFQRIRGSRIAMNYIWVFLGQNIGTVFSMLSLIFTLRIISTNDYGAMVIIQTYGQLISNIICIRTFNGTIKFLTEAEQTNDIKKTKQYISTGFALDVAAGIIAFIFGIILLNPITALMGWDAETVRFVNMYLPVVLLLPMLNGTAVGVLRKLGFFKQVNEIHAIIYGCQTLVLIITWVLKVGNLQVVLVEYALTEALEGVALFIYSLKKINQHEEYRSFWKEGLCKESAFLKYNIYYGLTSTFDQILGNVSTLLINKYIGNFATAYIKVITRICSLFTKLTNPISQVLYPELCEWVAKRKEKKAFKLSMRYFASVCVVGTVLLCVLFSTYGWWISIFDPEMASAKYESLLYMVYTLLGISLICINQMMFAMDLVRENLGLVIVFNILYVIGLIPAIKNWSIYGFLLLQILQIVFVGLGKIFFITRKMRNLEGLNGMKR